MGQFAIINLIQGFEDKHIEDLNTNSNYGFDLDDGTEIKYSDYIEELFMNLSTTYKDVPFVVMFEGESIDDFWTTVYYNGDSITENAELIHPNYNNMIKQITNK